MNTVTKAPKEQYYKRMNVNKAKLEGEHGQEKAQVLSMR